MVAILAVSLAFHAAPAASAANTVLGAGGQINTCASISSPNGQAVLRMQCDGNLVLVFPGNRPVWSSGTGGQPDAVARMQGDGNFVVYSRGNVPRWSTSTGGNNGAVLVLQDDGNLVVVAPGNRPVWSTQTSLTAPATSSPAARVVELTNAQRARAHCGPLRVDGGLAAASQNYAADMAARNYFSHTGRAPTPASSTGRAQAAGVSFRTLADNIAMGYRDADSVVVGWMNSEGHRRNILTCSFTRTGVGYDARNSGRWVQMFAN
ncbi:CAP domain-containing protein [Actinomycetospora sp. NBRC 106378]|uniref:CAP domain-containing protein n=1 Tax=Actinomycetospora sp. NBRC 106378 TaxID=3032208 RepID=UPI0024A0A467|nr:CAP domain-containing protein [Actinomycetospora sp. NBRC 106378]GLZ51710.1 hypothetical protein Acsp07_13270 [Actinomycetospora sp. NBRC 106378]